ncbi:tetratricopeptide repeat protein [Halothiobacillus sp. DCM-1]|uniref:tetratricopeptide repeat protein n=1 Tax=Halothiobacillus sp. DCM-1 TaxID=3112558 RepID=UPI003247370F
MNPLALFRLSLAALSIALLAGCASAPPRPPATSQPIIIQQPPIPPAVQAKPLIIPGLTEQNLPAPTEAPLPNTAPVPTASAPAVLALMTRAEAQTQSGDLGGADATLERAVQIQPNNSRLWVDFANLRLKQGQPAAAEQFALRAVQYAQTNAELQRAWMTVAAARSAQGDTAGAAEARRKAGFVPGQMPGQMPGQNRS